jgi:hypothetical protein
MKFLLDPYFKHAEMKFFSGLDLKRENWASICLYMKSFLAYITVRTSTFLESFLQIF